MVRHKTFRLTTDDLSMLWYLYVNKVASLKQVERDIYFNQSRGNIKKRFKLIKDAKLIKTVRSFRDQDRSYVYTLTKGGFDFIKRKTHTAFNSDRFKSDSVEHDLVLTDLRSIIKQNPIVREYYTENEVHSYPIFDEDEKWSIFKSLRFDACFYCQKDSGSSRIFGLQYEQSQKRESDYSMIVTDYYTEDLIDYILYVCINSSIENKIKMVERKISKGNDKKIYFLQSESLFSNPEQLIFTNQDNKRINLS